MAFQGVLFSLIRAESRLEAVEGKVAEESDCHVIFYLLDRNVSVVGNIAVDITVSVVPAVPLRKL